MPTVTKRDLKRWTAAAGTDGAGHVAANLAVALREGKLRPADLSLRDLAEGLIEDGAEWLEEINPRRKGARWGGAHLSEALNAVDTSAFSNLTGQWAYSAVRQGYDAPEFIDDQLCTVVHTDFLDGERIPGVGEIGDVAEVVQEGMPFPPVGIGEEWIQTVPPVKRGFYVPITREILIADRTGLVIRRCTDGGKWLRRNREKRVIDCAVGVTNNYNYKGVASNTYLTSGAYVNAIASGNALDASGNEWRALEKLELLWDAITDPNTGEPVTIRPGTLLVPTALRRSANRIIGATEVETVDMRANAATVRTRGPNPYQGAGLTVVSSPYVKLRTGSATKWFWGNFKEAIWYMENWGVETDQLGAGGEAAFLRDIVQMHKVSERGAPQVVEPRYVGSSDA